MAAITLVQPENPKFAVLRNATAQANTGQTDWILRPEWAKYLIVYLNVTATAGTTPLIDFSLLTVDPVSRDDSHVIKIGEHGDLTDITGVAQVVMQVGPGVTGIADDATIAATGDSYASINAVLPAYIGFKTTLDRTTGDETYTYTLAYEFRG